MSSANASGRSILGRTRRAIRNGRSILGQARRAIRKSLGPTRLIVETDARPSAAIILAGSARSGTTWISEVINHDRRLRVLFEPFHVKEVPLVAALPGRPRPYLRPEADDPAWDETARRILSGKVRHPWIDRFNTTRLSRRRLIKEIHANLILKWLHAHYPETPLLLLLRHPCAVAYSQRSLRIVITHDELRRFLDQPELMADHLEPFRGLIRETTDEFGILVLLWCLENYVPLRQFRPGEAMVLFYEQLRVEPEAYLRPILEWVRRPYDEAILAKLSRPSRTSWGKHSSMREGRDPITNWREGLTPGEIRRAVEILRATGMDAIYSDEALPTAGGIERLRDVAVAQPGGWPAGA